MSSWLRLTTVLPHPPIGIMAGLPLSPLSPPLPLPLPLPLSLSTLQSGSILSQRYIKLPSIELDALQTSSTTDPLTAVMGPARKQILKGRVCQSSETLTFD